MFKRKLLDKILSGDKWVTRRPTIRKKGAQQYEVGEKVGLRCGYVKFQAFVTIERKYKQMLGDMTEKDAHAEGFRDLDAFKAFWLKIYKRWNSAEVVWVYEWDPKKVQLANKNDCNAKINGF